MLHSLSLSQLFLRFYGDPTIIIEYISFSWFILGISFNFFLFLGGFPLAFFFFFSSLYSSKAIISSSFISFFFDFCLLYIFVEKVLLQTPASTQGWPWVFKLELPHCMWSNVKRMILIIIFLLLQLSTKVLTSKNSRMRGPLVMSFWIFTF